MKTLEEIIEDLEHARRGAVALEAENRRLKEANRRLTNWIIENVEGAQVHTDTGLVVT